MTEMDATPAWSRRNNDPVYRGAVLLTALGTELAARVLNCLGEDEMERLIQRMSRLGHVSGTERDRVVTQTEGMLRQYLNGISAGPEYSRKLLEQAIGPERAASLLAGEKTGVEKPLTLESILRDTPPETLAGLVAEEHPQMISVLASQLSIEKAAPFLLALPAEIQIVVAERLAQLETPNPRALRMLEDNLIERVRLSSSGENGAGGPRAVADILGQMRRASENLIISSLEERDPELVRRINKYRFTFDNLLEQDDRTLQRILRDLDSATLPMVLKGLNEEQQAQIYRNMSERAAERVREEVENLGPVRLRDVESAQQDMVNVAKALGERGEVNLVQASSGAAEEEEALV